jgi:hypothetical protein
MRLCTAARPSSAARIEKAGPWGLVRPPRIRAANRRRCVRMDRAPSRSSAWSTRPPPERATSFVAGPLASLPLCAGPPPRRGLDRVPAESLRDPAGSVLVGALTASSRPAGRGAWGTSALRRGHGNSSTSRPPHRCCSSGGEDQKRCGARFAGPDFARRHRPPSPDSES